MGQVIDFWTSRPVPDKHSEHCMRCRRCGADLWTITDRGDVRCADCDEPCPYRMQMKNEN